MSERDPEPGSDDPPVAGPDRREPKISVRPAVLGDREELARMRSELWPEDGAETHAREIDELFAQGIGRPYVALLAFDVTAGDASSPSPVGFAELSVRPVVDGCTGDRVGYLEGWYVAANRRRAGVGRALLAAGEAWAREHGCREMGSDVDLGNLVSDDAHRACGFEEVARVTLYRKTID